MHRAYVGIGSNLGDPIANVRAGIVALLRLGTVGRTSSLYRTKAWGLSDQPDYINAVSELHTELEPRQLLEKLQQLETGLGRVPTTHWGPRVIDFDILTYDDARIEENGLRIPHPRMLRRAFVLVPLAEIDPGFASARDALDVSERASVARLRGFS